MSHLQMEPTLHSEAEAFFELARELMIVRTLEGKLLAVNPAIERILGWTQAEAAAMDLPALVHLEDRALRLGDLERLRKTGGSSSWDCRCLSKSGVYKWLQWTCTVDLASERVYFVGRDLTELNDLKERLESSQQHAEAELSHLLTHVRCLLWQAEVWVEGDELLWQTEIRNTAAAEQFLPIEIPPDGDYSKAFYQAKLPEEADRMRRLGEDAIVSGQSGYQQEYRLRLVGGEIRWLFEDVSIEPLAADRWRLTGVCTDVSERKLAEEAMSQILTGANCLFWQAKVTDVDGRLRWKKEVHKEETAQHFLPMEIPAGKSYGEVFEASWHPDDVEQMHRISRDSIRSGAPGYRQEFRILRPDGQIRWLAEDVSIKFLGAGQWRLTGVCTDITDSIKAKQEVSQVLESARCLLWQAEVTEDGDKLRWNTQFRNPEAAQAFMPLTIPPGYSYTKAFDAARLPEEAAGMLMDVPSDIPPGKSGYQQEFRIRTATGEIRWLSEDVSIEPIEPGRWRFTGVCIDITDRKLAQEETTQVLASAHCLLWQADVEDIEGELEWNLEFRNVEAAQKFLPVEIPAGGTYSDGFFLARPRRHSVAINQLSTEALRTGQNGYQQEFSIRCSDGDLRWLSEDVHIEKRGSGRWRLTGVCTDITERKAAESSMSQVQSTARCLLWQAKVVDDGENLAWNIDILNPEAAQQLLAMEVLPGDTYSHAFYLAKLPEDLDRMELLSTTALRSGQTSYQQEYRVRVAGGAIRWLDESVSIEKEGEGGWRLTGVCVDVTERKRAEEEIELVLNSARCLLWQADVTDRDGVLEWGEDLYNTGAYDDLGSQTFGVRSSNEGTYYKTFSGTPLPEDTAEMDRTSEAAIRGGKGGYRQEYRVRTQEGNIHWLSEDVTIEGRGDGQWRLTGVCTDITERRLAEEALRRSEASYQRIVANVPGVVSQLLLHPDGTYRCLYLNAACREMFGREPREFEEDASLILATVYPEDRQSFVESFSAAALALSPWKWEGRFYAKGGEVRWLDAISRPELQPNGDILWDCLLLDATARKNLEAEMKRAQDDLQDRVHDRTRDLRHANVALQNEILERKQAQEELKESESRYRAIVEDQTEMICRFLADGTLIFVNDAHCRYYEALPEYLIGKSFIDFLSPEDAIRIRAHLASLGPENPVASYEISGLSRDGELRWQHWTDRCIWNEEGEFICFQSVGRDITARKKTQEALLLAKEEAERANLAKSEFLSRMSHELRTPLNAILGFGQLLDQNDLAPVQKESVQHILKGGRHLLDLINEVLDLARVEAGRTDVSIEPVSIAEVVQESLDLVRSLGSEYNVRFEVDVTNFEPYYTLADRQRLKQILINLLSNGIKYNRAGGHVEILCEVEATQVRIHVRDTGKGIRAEDLPKLFIPFERLDASNSTVEGTGLGLALSKRLIGLMNGSLEVESVEGVGSVFSITLPVAESSERRVKALSDGLLKQEVEPVEKRFSMLCIEDNPSNLRLVQVILASRPSIELLTAMHGREGLDLARRLKPDLILLDINLPDISGGDVLQVLKEFEDTKHIPVVVISADATPLRVERLLSAGADAYLTKPLDVGEFLSTLDGFLK